MAWIFTQRATSKYWRSIASSSDGTKLVVCEPLGYIWTSTNSGANWTQRATSLMWRSVASSSDGTKLVAVVYGGYIWTSTDSGANWTQRATSKNWGGVTSSSDGTKLAAIDIGGYIWTSTDSGANWTQRGGTQYWSSVASSSDGIKLVATSSAYIWTSTDSGANWNTRATSNNWYSVASSSDGVNLVACVYNGYIWTSTNSGVSWTQRGTNKYWQSVASSSDGTKLVAVDNNNGYIWTSTDSGVNWIQNATSLQWWAVASSSDGNKLFATVYPGYIWTGITTPTITTQAVSSITQTTATGNGNITSTGSDATCDKRGIVYSTSSYGDPGNVAPVSSSYGNKVEETGTFNTGAFTESITVLSSRVIYYARAYAHNSAGYSYGDEVTFTTVGFINPANIYSSNNVYATLAAVNGILTVEVSKDAGVNWSAPLTKTFGASDTLETLGAGATETWGMSLTRADMVDANFRVRLTHNYVSQIYKTFGFSTGSDILTGIEIAIEGNYASSTLSLDLLEVKIHYGTSILPVQAGSQAYASNGRKAGEGASAGTGVLVFYDGNNWIASDSGGTVAS